MEKLKGGSEKGEILAVFKLEYLQKKKQNSFLLSAALNQYHDKAQRRSKTKEERRKRFGTITETQREVHLPSRCWAGSRERVLVTVEVGWGSLGT